MELSSQRCYHHAHREAVARCPSCLHHYCRECSTEHDGQMLCASCLARLSAGKAEKRSLLRILTAPVALLIGLLACWLFFQAIGGILVRLPAEFHEGRPHQWVESTSS